MIVRKLESVVRIYNDVYVIKSEFKWLILSNLEAQINL